MDITNENILVAWVKKTQNFRRHLKKLHRTRNIQRRWPIPDQFANPFVLITSQITNSPQAHEQKPTQAETHLAVRHQQEAIRHI